MKGSLDLVVALLAAMVSVSAAALSSAPVADAASDPAAGRTSITLSTGLDHLSNNTPAWHEYTARLRQQFGKRHIGELGIINTNRFGLNDNQISALYARPVTESSTITFDGAVSPTHQVLPRYGVGALVQTELAPAWLVHTGARTTSYEQVTVNQVLLGLERYVSSFSWFVGWRPTHAFGQTVHSGELRGSYYYSDVSSVGIILAAGQEANSLGRSVNLTSVRSVAVVGRHRINPYWDLTYTFAHTRQGDFYQRNSTNVGIQYTF